MAIYGDRGRIDHRLARVGLIDQACNHKKGASPLRINLDDRISMISLNSNSLHFDFNVYTIEANLYG